MKKLRTRYFIILAATAVLMTGCGGGGGGGGDDTPSPTDGAYTGVRTQAYLDASNAQALVLGAYGGADYEGIIPLSVTNPAWIANDPYGLSTMFDHVAGLVRQDDQIKTQALLDPAMECLNYPNGYLSDSLVDFSDMTTETITGSIYYTNCDIGGVILDGTVTLMASINLETFKMTLSMDFNPVRYNDGITVYSLTGSLSGTATDPDIFPMVSHLALNMTLDNLSGKTYWLNNYVIDETEESSGVRSTISGRYYHNDYGYVDFVTDPNDKIFIPYNSFEPTYDGRLDYTGSNGSTATLWLGVNQSDYCINVVNASGSADLGTCAQ